MVNVGKYTIHGSYGYIYIIPAPSKGCQMVPEGYQFSILLGLIGTPLKVQVYR